MTVSESTVMLLRKYMTIGATLAEVCVLRKLSVWLSAPMGAYALGQLESSNELLVQTLLSPG